MALKSEFYPALSNSSSKEFKDLALQFCGAVSIVTLIINEIIVVLSK